MSDSFRQIKWTPFSGGGIGAFTVDLTVDAAGLSIRRGDHIRSTCPEAVFANLVPGDHHTVPVTGAHVDAPTSFSSNRPLILSVGRLVERRLPPIMVAHSSFV